MAEHGRGIIIPFRLQIRVSRESNHQLGFIRAPCRARWSFPVQYVVLQQIMLLVVAFLFDYALSAIFKMYLCEYMLNWTTGCLGERKVQHINGLQGHQHIRINRLRLFEYRLW